MASYGFDISKAGEALGTYTGNKIADAADSALSDALAKANAAIEETISKIENEMDAILVKGIDAIYNALGINDTTMELANTLLGKAAGAITKVSTILSMIPVDVNFTPSAGMSLSPLTTSFKDMALSMWKELQALYNELINAVITCIGSPIELLCGMVTTVVEWIEEQVDTLCYKYTGFHILEIYNMCIKGYLIIRTIKACNEINKLVDTGAGYKANVNVDVTIDKSAYKKQLYAQLYAYMDGLTTPLYNAFLMLQMKETVLLIKDFVTKFNNISLDELGKNILNIDDVVEILDHVVSADPIYVSYLEIKTLLLNNVSLVTNELKKVGENAKNTSALGSVLSTIAGAASAININTSVTATLLYAFEMDESKTEETGSYYVNAILYSDPSKCKGKIGKSLANVKVSGELVFSSASIANITLALIDAWNNASDSELTIIGSSNGNNRTYVFVIKPLNTGKTEDSSTETSVSNTMVDSNTTLFSMASTSSSNNNKSSGKSTLDDVTLEDLKTEYKAEASNNIILFDIVGALINSLKPLSKIIEEIAELISNYKINKAKVLSHANGNLGISFSKILEKLTGEKTSDSTDGSGESSSTSGSTSKTKSVDTNSQNFYTVRSKVLYNYLNVNIGLIPDNSSLATSTVDQTNEILDNAPVDISLTVKSGKETVFYFDLNSINGYTTTYKDGSYKNLPDINRDPSSQKVYINTSGKPYETSQILLLKSQGY